MKKVNCPFFDTSKTLCIGEIPHGTSDEEIQNYYSAYGDIKTIIVSTESKKSCSRGCGYIQFRSAESLRAALKSEQLAGMNVSEHSYGVSESDPSLTTLKTLYIGGVPCDCSDRELQDYYEQYDEVVCVKVVSSSKNNGERGKGYIVFRSVDGLARALANRK